MKARLQSSQSRRPVQPQTAQPSITGIPTADQLGIQVSGYMSEEATKAINEIKLKDRPNMKLEDWGMRGHAQTNITQTIQAISYEQIARVNQSFLTVEQFIQDFEKPHIPCVISNSTVGWDVDKHWTFAAVQKYYSEGSFKIAEDEDENKLRVQMKHFLEYLIHNKDDSPLYMFESSLEDSEAGKQMIQRIKPHPYFQDDLFSFVGEQKRPPYRWFLMGPTRSGTTVHIDPLCTSAWNTSLQGHKLWVMFPPHIPKSIIKSKSLIVRKKINSADCEEAIDWFLYVLPKLIQSEGVNNLQIKTCVQGPGETIFVPGGWWHAVLNLDNTMAITQNFMSHTNFDHVWRSTRVERPKFSIRLLESFKENSYSLYTRAMTLNHKDKFRQKKNENVENARVSIRTGQVKIEFLEDLLPVPRTSQTGARIRQRRLSTDTESNNTSSSSSSGSGSGSGSESGSASGSHSGSPSPSASSGEEIQDK